MNTATYFILNGPRVGEELPMIGSLKEIFAGKVIAYEPAPKECCWALGPCVVVLGSKIQRMRSGNLVIGHPGHIPTLLNPRTGEVRECEWAVRGQFA